MSSYNSAVTSFNIYQNQYALNALNYAENNLENARTHYNTLVSLYNAAPSTVEKPVYLPYSFFQGDMRCGFTANGSIKIKNQESKFNSNHVNTHFVRLNTKYTDALAINRRDSEYPLGNVAEELYGNMFAVAEDVSGQFTKVPFLPDDNFIANLSNQEKACVSYSLHPLKNPDVDSIGIPTWALPLVNKCRYNGVKIPPPPLTISDCEIVFIPKQEDLVEIDKLRSLVCRIDCKSFFGDSHGTGSLVSSDGLILTAAHVVRGYNNKVTFNNGVLKGDYDSEIVFIDDKNDVALIRAKGLKSITWLNLDLESVPNPGEGVIAIGYPGVLSEGDKSQDFVTRGMISASNKSKGWLVADLTVASGNSGGPLISSKSGKVIGIVSQVISTSIKKDFASSGYWCKAFPSFRLNEAVGVVK
jgi:S1-C subfamily serine protease